MTSLLGRAPDPVNMQAKDMNKEATLWFKNFEDYVLLLPSTLPAAKMKALLLNYARLEIRRLAEGQ